MGETQRIRFVRSMVWAVVAPFFLLSAITSGLMPVQTSDGIAVVICTGNGPLELHIDPDTGEPLRDSSGDRQKVCDWASIKVSALLPAPEPAPASAPLSFAAQPPVPPAILSAGRATGLPPSTGPPLRV